VSRTVYCAVRRIHDGPGVVDPEGLRGCRSDRIGDGHNDLLFVLGGTLLLNLAQRDPPSSHVL